MKNMTYEVAMEQLKELATKKEVDAIMTAEELGQVEVMANYISKEVDVKKI